MATTNFYLKEANKHNQCLILLVYQDRGRKFKFSTKVLVEKPLWDGNRIRGKSLEVMERNRKIKYYEDLIAEIEMEALRNNKIYSIDVVESKFKLKTEINSHESEFFLLFEKFIGKK